MPIRFRCAYCNQLLGIARRKSGTVVRCPTCAGQVVVPQLEETDRDEGRHGGQQGMFEGNELDRLLEGAAGEQPSVIGPAIPLPPAQPPPVQHRAPAPPPAYQAPPPPPPPAPPPYVPPPEPQRMAAAPPAAAPQPGFRISPGKNFILSVIVVVALAVAFFAGYLVGKMQGGKPSPRTPSGGK